MISIDLTNFIGPKLTPLLDTILYKNSNYCWILFINTTTELYILNFKLLNWKNEKKFRLEIFCFLIGALAIISVKKQKRLSTSLFDQRKREATNTVANGNRSFSVSENDDEIEFTPMTNQQKEMVSLMEINNNNNDHMEIIWDYNIYNNNNQY